MKTGDAATAGLARLILDKFYGSVTIRFESGKVTHVETETRRAWQYKDLPDTTLGGEGNMPARVRQR